ncbi:hypothetical protein ACH5RR_035543 [Cinchona calisaya]|uniref:Retrotransposon gag domain-containing protein n=1 Tax=Cinchona calisaya TaxID=153742 RepID=A0ABD2Y5L1_9GENT
MRGEKNPVWESNEENMKDVGNFFDQEERDVESSLGYRRSSREDQKWKETVGTRSKETVSQYVERFKTARMRCYARTPEDEFVAIALVGVNMMNIEMPSSSKGGSTQGFMDYSKHA